MNRMSRRDFLNLAASATACTLLPTGCRKVFHSARPNILWIVWDTVRSDHMSLYGYGKPTTPYLDSWAKDARVFTNCVSAANCELYKRFLA